MAAKKGATKTLSSYADDFFRSDQRDTATDADGGMAPTAHNLKTAVEFEGLLEEADCPEEELGELQVCQIVVYC